MTRKHRLAAAHSELGLLWPAEHPEKSVALLKALHILTREGTLNADSRRKLKQVLHLTQLLRPALETLLRDGAEPVLADLGAGKSYLGFILYDLILGPAGHGRIIGIEARPELIALCEALAKDLGFARMDFICSPIAAAALPCGRADMVAALHACDTATDDAIRFALRHEAKIVALVPCCQAEVAQLLKAAGKDSLHQLWRHPVQRRDFGAHLTNVMRGLVLEAHGYKVRVTEFVGLEHSLKNELILAERHQMRNPLAKAELDALIEQFGIRPGLLDAMADF